MTMSTKPAAIGTAGAKFGTRAVQISPKPYRIGAGLLRFHPLRAEIRDVSSDVPDTTEEAAGVLKIVSRRMAGAYPFHAHLLSLAAFEPASSIETMGVTVRGARVVFVYNPKFVLAHSFDELLGVLHHEVLHVVFGHMMQSPANYPDQMALTIAQEVTVNEWVPERLPGKPILLKDYPWLPPGEDTDTRYHRLVAKREKMAVAACLDDHGLWDEVQDSSRVAESVIMSAVRRAADLMTPDEAGRMTKDMLDAIDEACRGKAAGRDVEQLDGRHGQATVAWKVVLRRFVGSTTARHPSYLRPPRRFPHLLGIVPGNLRRQESPRIMAVIDTSGSMDADLLSQIRDELQVIRATHKVTVVECDDRVRRVYDFDGELGEVHGRGDTDLRPPFDPDVLGKIRPDVVVYFTDGFGPAPARRPGVAVLWCLTPGGVSPALWGRFVRMG